VDSLRHRRHGARQWRRRRECVDAFTEVRKCAGPSQLERRQHDVAAPMPPRGPSGVGGDVTALTSSSITIVNFDGTASTYVINSSTVVTNLRQSATTASLALGENVRIVASSTDTSVAGSIELVPRHSPVGQRDKR